MIILYIILLTVSAISKAVQDTITHHFHQSIFVGKSDWWNPEKSWKLKYKKDKLEPLFFGSTTFLVWVTDAWHCMYFIHATAWQSIVALIVVDSYLLPWWYYIVVILGFKLLFGFTFELFYSKILKIGKK